LRNYLQVRAVILIAGLGWLASQILQRSVFGPNATGQSMMGGSGFLLLLVFGMGCAYYAILPNHDADKSRSSMLIAEYVFFLTAIVGIAYVFTAGVNKRAADRRAEHPAITQPVQRDREGASGL
jgi:hypothetical protein